MKNSIKKTATRTLIASLLAATAFAATWIKVDTGGLSGLNTVDTTPTVYMDDGTTFNSRIVTAGAGNHYMTVKVQAQRINGTWKTLDSFSVAHGSNVVVPTTVENLRSGQERIRWCLFSGACFLGDRFEHSRLSP